MLIVIIKVYPILLFNYFLNSGFFSFSFKVKVNPGKHPSLTWQRKLDTEDTALSEFNISVKEMVAMVCIKIHMDILLLCIFQIERVTHILQFFLELESIEKKLCTV